MDQPRPHSHSRIPFHPVLAGWFSDTFGEPTDVQTEAWRAISSGRHTLIAAPTGSGKTLAALLPCLDRVVRDKSREDGASRKPGVRILYVTPLKALNNDIHHHAIGFIESLEARAEAEGGDWPGIRCEVRTGDTSASRRAAILRRPPELLVTTPESLYLMLTSDKGRAILETVEQIIVDEIHDVAADKRGAHLSLSLERLALLRGRSPQRIGVSATQKPLERVARFLGGREDEGEGYAPRQVAIVESAIRKRMDVRITMPDQSRPAATREAVWLPLLERLTELLEGSRSALVFVNSRRLCERLCLRLNDHFGYEMARSHHGSISRERRLEVEALLKEGSLRCIVATSSLELGIDVGHIDLVIQVDSPQEAARGIQRIGRAGHAVGEASRGILLARQKGVLPELAVLGRQIALREIEEIRIPEAPMDVLSQQTVAMVAMDDWDVGELHRAISRSDSFADYPRDRFEAMLRVLAGFYPFARPLLDWDRRTGMLTKRSNTAMAAITGVGTIPQTGNYPVHHLDSRAHLGELDEEFIEESRVGDVFQLGTSSWMIRDIRNDRVYVTEAGNRFSEIPFWKNEAGGRPYELGEKIGALLGELERRLELGGEAAEPETDGQAAERDELAAEWLQEVYGMDHTSARELIALVRSQHRACGLPTERRIVVEHYRDVMNQTHVVVHNPRGRTANRAWLLAIERQFEQTLPYRLYGNAKDNGIEFVLPEWDSSWLGLFRQVVPGNVDRLLTEAVTGSPLLAVAFRRIAETGLLLSRSFSRTPLWQKRLRSEELLRDSLPYAENFPYLREAMEECLRDYLGIGKLKEMLTDLVSGELEVSVKETAFPSPFAAQFIADYASMKLYEGDGLDETTRLQLLNASKELAEQWFGATGRDAVSRSVLEEESRRLDEPERKTENAEELAALLKRMGDLTSGELAKLAGERALVWLERLREQGKAATADLSGDGEYRWIAGDERETYAAFPDADESLLFVLGRYADRVVSFTEPELCERYTALSLPAARRAVELLLSRGAIERAPHAASEDERLWTSSKVASRLVRLSIRHARAQAEPVEADRWCGRIAFLQHVWPGTQLQGEEGLREALGRLQGMFLPLSHWETIVLPSRITAYRKETLDMLCASGELIWIGRKEPEDKEGRIAFFLSESRALYGPILEEAASKPSRHPELLARIEQAGASFLTRLGREEGRAPSELLADLMDLVWEGRVSNDQFAPLRLQIGTAKSAPWAKTGSGLGRWYATRSLVGETSDDKSSMAIEADSSYRPERGTASRNQGESPVLAWTHHLLNAYGLINKDVVARTAPYPWDRFYPALKKLEEWGMVTRGAFLQGSTSLQFTTREMSETIRQPLPEVGDSDVVAISSADPANPYGVLADWPDGRKGASFSRKPGNFLVMLGERWLFWIEGNGKKAVAMDGAAGKDDEPDPRLQAERLMRAFRTVIRGRKLVKVKLEVWNGEPVLDTALGRELLALGAERDNRSLVVWSK